MVEGALFKFFSITLYSQYLLRCIIYIICKILLRSGTAGGTVLQKRSSIIFGLKVHSKVWDNFWQLKAL